MITTKQTILKAAGIVEAVHMAIAILRHGSRSRGRRECESCRVQTRHPNLSFCPNCGHAYGEPAVKSRLAVPHPALQMAEQRRYV
jgi:hypothetical protein